MAVTHTTASAEDLLGEPIREEEAAAQNVALDRVLEHLTAEGVNAQLVKRLVIECGAHPGPFLEKLRYPPQLIIYADAGRRVARVTIGARSGAYMVELARGGPGNELRADKVEVVPASQPGYVALLVARNAGEAA